MMNTLGTQLELALRILAALVAFFLVSSFGPYDPSPILHAGSFDAVRKALSWPNEGAPFVNLRASLLMDCLFLLAHGFLFRFLLVRFQKPSIFPWLMMTFNVAENVALLALIDDAVRRRGTFGFVHACFCVFYTLKWLFVAATYRRAGQAVHWMFYIPSACALGLMAAEWTMWSHVAWIRGALWVSLLPLFLRATVKSDVKGLCSLLFAIRVPLFTLAFCASYTMLALGPLRTVLLSTLFYHHRTGSWWSVALSATLGFLVAHGIAIHCSTVLRLGPSRFPIAMLPSSEIQSVLLFILNASYAPVALTLCTGAYLTAGLWTDYHAAILLGFVFALIVVALTDFTNAYVVHNGPAGGALPNLFLILRARFERPRTYVVNRALNFPAPGWFKSLQDKPTIKTLRFPGYLENGRVRAEHVYSVIFLGLAAWLYVGILVWVFHWGNQPPLTIASIFLLVFILSLILNGLAFFGDRYHIPALLMLVVAGTISEVGHETDYVFRTTPRVASTYKTPRQVLSPYESRHPVLVAASGGGIQAAAWMTTVLSNLDKDRSLDLKERIALISAVSGGAIGAYHLGVHWEDWEAAVGASMESSLGPIAVAIAGPDFFHPLILCKRFAHIDRGYALEETIQRMSGSPRSGETLDEWANRSGSSFPAMLFNTTSAETGAPVAFATSLLPSESFQTDVKNELTGRHVVQSWRSFVAGSEQKLAQTNMRVATAARLSATFPYVSPSARPVTDEKEGDTFRYHFVDGGYYDNYGLVALIQWLDDAIHPQAEKPFKVTILVIRGQEAAQYPGSKSEGRSTQFSAPVKAFLHMRDYAQWQGPGELIRLLQRRWQGQVEINTVVAQFPTKCFSNPLCAETPLTWKLTPDQKTCLDEGWQMVKEKLKTELQYDRPRP